MVKASLIKVVIFFFCIFMTGDLNAYPRGPQHGVELYGTPKYPKDFEHFDYVNPKAPKEGRVTFSLIGTFDSLNPFVIKGTPAAGMVYLYPSYYYATLMAHSHDEPLSAYGYVAKTIEVAEDGKSVTFQLREEAVFHDGSPILAKDIVFSFNILKEKGLPFFKSYYRKVASAEALDTRTVRFNFTVGDDRELPMIIGDIPILSQDYYAKHDFSKSDLIPPMGSGPYQIGTVDPGKSITYKRVQNWWGQNLPVNRGRYNFEEIKYIYFRDDAVALEAFKGGLITIRAERIAKNWATSYESTALAKGDFIKKHIKDSNPNGMTGLIFNIRKPIFSDIRVRKALALVYDFEWANKNLFYGSYERSLSYFSNSDLAATALPSQAELKLLEPFKSQLPEDVFSQAFQLPVYKSQQDYRSQLKVAQKLLQDAGWEIRQGRLLHIKDGKPFEFQILIPDASFARPYNAYINNLKTLGITAGVRVVDTAQYQERLDNFDYDMITGGFGQSITPGNEQEEFFGSKSADHKGSRNYIGIKNAAIDTIIEQLIHTQNRQDLVTHTQALDRILLWNFYMVPGWHLDGTWIAYWKQIKLPEILPIYTLDIDAWWYEDTK